MRKQMHRNLQIVHAALEWPDKELITSVEEEFPDAGVANVEQARVRVAFVEPGQILTSFKTLSQQFRLEGLMSQFWLKKGLMSQLWLRMGKKFQGFGGAENGYPLEGRYDLRSPHPRY
jgi:hypothetical protein